MFLGTAPKSQLGVSLGLQHLLAPLPGNGKRKKPFPWAFENLQI